jgi:ATP-dependent DNA helicase RecG
VDVHRPTSIEEATAARNRLAYQELFEMGLLATARRMKETCQTKGFAHRIDGYSSQHAQDILDVTFTEDQKCAIDDILADMQQPHHMQRLLLGDVGTGKTFVAIQALLVAAQSGTQAAMMAPTEVLAKQYVDAVGPILEKEGISWVLMTGSMGSTQRSEALQSIAQGEITVAFGTHALIQKDVTFKNLTVAIIDEQHRFGVAQRQLLRSKAKVSPDMLFMTATPIPRSLALTLYGDLDISTLRTRPIKGAGVVTHMRSEARVADAHQAVKSALEMGQQAYVICALIDQSTKLEVNAATDLAKDLAAREYRDWRVALLHGAMKSSEKDEVMSRFSAGDIDVLVSTTVVEVGVDVHNATRMIVYNAERFGLAQLHQLRGRVGRGSISGEIWLISDGKGKTARNRFEALCSTDDGFMLADMDLALRGAGDVGGTRQHGSVAFRVVDIVRDLPIIEVARRDAIELLTDDPNLEKTEHRDLALRLAILQEGYEQWVGAG